MAKLTLEQFAAKHRLTTTADVDGHIHAGLRSKPTTKTYQRFYDRKLSELQAARDKTERQYLEALASGEIQALTLGERLAQTADGHDDNPSVQAARRLLAKRRAALADNAGDAVAWQVNVNGEWIVYLTKNLVDYMKDKGHEVRALAVIPEKV